MAQSSYDDLAKGERQRFESAKRMSLELAKNIADVSYRDAALESIVELCMKAHDIDTARISAPSFAEKATGKVAF